VAGLIAGAVLRRLPERVFAAVGLLLFTFGAAARAVPSLPVVLLGTLAIGVGLPWVLVAVFTAVQQHTEPDLVGRVAAAAGTAVFGPNSLAVALGAGLVALVDYRLQLVGVGAAGLLAAWLLLLRRVTAGPGAAGSPAADPSTGGPQAVAPGTAEPGATDAGTAEPGVVDAGAADSAAGGVAVGGPVARGLLAAEREGLPKAPADTVTDHQVDPGDMRAQG
jgi:hypothetical protein